jgi:ferrochelatase
MGDPSGRAFLLLAFGGAGGIDEVGPFIRRVLNGRAVPEALLKSAEERYRLIGGSSPLLRITRGQAVAIEEALGKYDYGLKGYVGMRFSAPFIKDALLQMQMDGVKSAVAVIMSPFTSAVATGGYLKDIGEARKTHDGMSIDFVEDWHANPVFIDAIAKRIMGEINGLTTESVNETLVIFSTHSLPVHELKGDPYEEKVRETVALVAGRLSMPATGFRLGYQSRGGGGRPWLGPDTIDVMKEAVGLGKKAVIIVPLGFTADHVETLYDIDILFRDTAKSLGLAFRRTPSLNASPDFTGLIAGLIKRKIS